MFMNEKEIDYDDSAMERGDVIIGCAVSGCRNEIVFKDQLILGAAKDRPDLMAAELARGSGWHVRLRGDRDPLVICKSCYDTVRRRPPYKPRTLKCPACGGDKIKYQNHDAMDESEGELIHDWITATCRGCRWSKRYRTAQQSRLTSRLYDLLSFLFTFTQGVFHGASNAIKRGRARITSQIGRYWIACIRVRDKILHGRRERNTGFDWLNGNVIQGSSWNERPGENSPNSERPTATAAGNENVCIRPDEDAEAVGTCRWPDQYDASRPVQTVHENRGSGI